LNKKIKDALNRERNNVGRVAYSERIKSILLECKQKAVAEKLVNDLQEFETGNYHDELHWIDVSTHATKLLNSYKKVVFFTPQELQSNSDFIERVKDDGYEIITISENIRDKISGQNDYEHKPIVDLDEYIEEWSESFEFSFVEKVQLNEQERKIYDMTDEIFKFIGGKPNVIKAIKISETMRPNGHLFSDAVGFWNGSEIIIKRSELQSLERFASTLLHETAHAISSASDVSIEFENALTKLLGTLVVNKLKI
jgi:hypothetical protein